MEIPKRTEKQKEEKRRKKKYGVGGILKYERERTPSSMHANKEEEKNTPILGLILY